MFKTTLTVATLALLLAGPAFADDDRRGRGDDRGDRYDHRDDDRDHRYDRRDRDRDHRYDRRDHDRDHRYDRRHDRRYDRRDGWRDDRYWTDNVRSYYRGRYYDRDRRDYRHWRHVPPARYGLSFGYRSGYELAWDDWRRHGRHDRGWRRHSFRGDYAFRAGYEAGWRDAARYFSRGYRPRYWERDPYGSWYFGFEITG